LLRYFYILLVKVRFLQLSKYLYSCSMFSTDYSSNLPDCPAILYPNDQVICVRLCKYSLSIEFFLKPNGQVKNGYSVAHRISFLCCVVLCFFLIPIRCYLCRVTIAACYFWIVHSWIHNGFSLMFITITFLQLFVGGFMSYLRYLLFVCA
jgi:hypothetical protein